MIIIINSGKRRGRRVNINREVFKPYLYDEGGKKAVKPGWRGDVSISPDSESNLFAKYLFLFCCLARPKGRSSIQLLTPLEGS